MVLRKKLNKDCEQIMQDNSVPNRVGALLFFYHELSNDTMEKEESQDPPAG